MSTTTEATTLIEVVPGLDDEVLARVWCDLNRYEWPRDLSADLQPFWWDHPELSIASKRDRRHGFAAPFMDYADARLGREALLDEWNRPRGETDARASTEGGADAQ